MGVLVRKLLVFVHRWIGICLCLFFAMWFASGMVMMYVPFPSLPDADRIGMLDPIDVQSINVSPVKALEGCASPDVVRLRVISVVKRPTYVCHGANGQLHTVYANVGGHAEPLTKTQAARIASTFLNAPTDVKGPIQYDQWIVHQKFDPYRPFFRVELEDEDGTHLYLSVQTGEFLQRTTRHARFWNYLGSVAHWIYPTALRKHWAWWDQTVWWLSLFGIVGAAIGFYLGIFHLLRTRRAEKDVISPFRNWMRWHHILGLFSGLFILTWILSGWLSMDHGRLFSMPTATAAQVRDIQGLSTREIAERITTENLRDIIDAREIGFHAFGGSEFLLAKNQHGLINAHALDTREIDRVISAVWFNAPIKERRLVPSGDVYTQLREGRLAAGTIRVALQDAASTWVHVNPYTGELLSVMDRSRRLYRWLFNGFHSLDIPGLVEKRPLWDAIMLALLSTGLVASLTGVVIGSKRLLRSFIR